MLRRLAIGTYVPAPEPPPPFTPESIPGALVFDASRPDTMVLSGSDVNSWSSTDGSVTLPVASGAAAPQLLTSGYSRVDCTSGWRAVRVDSLSYTQNRPGLTIYCIAKAASIAPSPRAILFTIANNFSTRFGLTYGEATGVGTGDFSCGGRRLDADTFYNLRAGTWSASDSHLFGGVVSYASQAMALYVNAVETTGTVTFAAGNSQNLNGGIVFGGPSAGTQFDGEFERIVLVNAAVSTLERQQIEGWLAWSTGRQVLLPGGHPYKTVRP